MMQSIRYHPLIERDTETHEFAPLFFTTDEKEVRKAHNCYLEEYVNGYYRLLSGKNGTVPYGGKLTITCPVCGGKLADITAGKHNAKLALYVCRACNN